MPTLTFPRAKLTRLITIAERLDTHALELVGDEGVYFMLSQQPAPRTMVHARECDPASGFDWLR